MARPLRLAVPGGVYHVMSRGNERQDIFRDDADRRIFLATVRSVTERMNVLCHSYCLMGNHYHFLLETPDGNISLAIRQLNGVYAQSFNRRHSRVGHLFQGRFKAILVEKETYLLTVSRYIVLNPVRSGHVARPSDWEWSSYRAHSGLIEPPPFLTVDWLLSQFGSANRGRAQEAYRKFVMNESGKSRLTTEPILGSEEFVARFNDAIADARSTDEIPRTQRFTIRPALEQIFAECVDRTTRDHRIRRAHIDHGYTMTEIARYLNLHRMTISRAVRGVRTNTATSDR